MRRLSWPPEATSKERDHSMNFHLRLWRQASGETLPGISGEYRWPTASELPECSFLQKW